MKAAAAANAAIKQKLIVHRWLSGQRMKQAARQLLVFVMPFLLFALFLLMYDVNPVDLYVTMFTSSFGSLYGLGEVLIMMCPILLTGLAAALPARAGLINVGGEGQLAIGALAATWFGVFYLGGLPSWIGLPAMMLVGALGGMLWVGIVGLLKVRANMNETITSLLLNYVAFYLVGVFVHGPLKDHAIANSSVSTAFPIRSIPQCSYRCSRMRFLDTMKASDC